MNLRARAGQELDPVVVAAAVKTVDEEIIELGAAEAQPAPAIVASAARRVRADELLEAAPRKGRQQRGQLGALRPGIL